MKKQDNFIHLFTEEGENLSGTPWNVYPRPSLVRDSFFCLNGDWDFTDTDGREEKIVVPFPPESLLSGVCRSMGKRPRLTYKKNFSLPDGFIKDKVILHFGAVDQTAEVCLNGNRLGVHVGGYHPFSFDITDILSDNNTLEVRVKDDLCEKILPYGKQCEKRGGMWYTPVSGIWQTVWIESVCEKYVKSLSIETGADFAKISSPDAENGEVTVETPDGDLTVPFENGEAVVMLSSPRMWSPEDPYLYRFTLVAGRDTVRSYFAIRTLEVKTVNGVPRLCLNGKPYFFHGLLDQGYFSDGIFIPASPVCYENDILAAKSFGFNTLRKHIKIEPQQFYYDCDRLGMIVFQDMINNSDYSFIRDTALPTVGLKRMNDKKLHKNPKSREAFISAMEENVDLLKNHPSICYWTIFNEGWGQFCSEEMYAKMKMLDPTRFIDTASGWFAGTSSDVESVHVYFKPVSVAKSDKPMVLSEFGGYSMKFKDHSFNPDKTYGYRFYEDPFEYEKNVYALYRNEIIPAVRRCLCGAIYTQLADVEDETNGILTYDRKKSKLNPEIMRNIARSLADEIK